MKERKQRKSRKFNTESKVYDVTFDCYSQPFELKHCLCNSNSQPFKLKHCLCNSLVQEMKNSLMLNSKQSMDMDLTSWFTLIHYPSCTDSIKPSLQFLCYFVVINASEGSLCFQNFLQFWIHIHFDDFYHMTGETLLNGIEHVMQSNVHGGEIHAEITHISMPEGS
jgi:hypothetical protein